MISIHGCHNSLLTYDLNLMYVRHAYNVNPSRPNPGRKEKIKLNFYFPSSL